MKILIIHGPNLEMLGKREPEIYGKETLNDINEKLRSKAKELSVQIEIFQSNSEGEIVDKILSNFSKDLTSFAGSNLANNHIYDYLIINPAAYTHYSIAIRDAILASNLKTIEVHISNVYKREEFRHRSVISDVVEGKIVGLGMNGYLLALDHIVNENK